MRESARDELNSLGIATIQDITQPVESLSGGQRQAVAVARAAMFGSKRRHHGRAHRCARRQGNRAGPRADQTRSASAAYPVVLISHDMPAVFEVADRIHVHRLGRRAGVVDPKKCTMSDVVSFITGAEDIPEGAMA